MEAACRPGRIWSSGLPQRLHPGSTAWPPELQQRRIASWAALVEPDPPSAGGARQKWKEGHAIMASPDPGPRSAVSLLADPADDVPRCRDRLERLWRRQVEEIIELSLAYHEAASAEHAGDRPELAAARSRRLQQALARTASAHHALAEIEAALARIDAGSYGICEQCGGRLRADWLEASPQLRYCRRCRPPRPDRWHPPRGAPGQDHHDR